MNQIPLNQTFEELERQAISWYNTVLAQFPHIRPTPAMLAVKLMEEATEAALACGMDPRHIVTAVRNTIEREQDKVRNGLPLRGHADAAEECADVAINAAIISGLVRIPLTPRVRQKLQVCFSRSYRVEQDGVVYRNRTKSDP